MNPDADDSMDSDSSDADEKERISDLKERDQFAARLRDKDKEKTRQVMSKSDKKVRQCFHSFIV